MGIQSVSWVNLHLCPYVAICECSRRAQYNAAAARVHSSAKSRSSSSKPFSPEERYCRSEQAEFVASIDNRMDGALMTKKVRRIVTGYNAAGKAVVKTDEQPTAAPRAGEGIKGCEIWLTDKMPVDGFGEPR